MTEKSYLDRVYRIDGSADANRALYDDWASQYDSDLREQGYATPTRLAALLARHLAPDEPILDFGCGTGLSGTALTEAGFTTIDGCDISGGMLAEARQTGAYRSLWENDPAGPLEVSLGAYSAIAAVGVISKGAAPAAVMDPLLDALRPGGVLAFSLNGHSTDDSEYVGKMEEIRESGRVTELAREDGDHLPGLGLTSVIYVLERR